MRRVILIDVMDTLVQEPFFERAPRFLGLTLDELMQAKHPTVWAEFECGEIDEPTMLARFFRDQRPFDGAGLKHALTCDYRWVPGMEALLAELAARSHEIHALSNYPHWYRLIEEQLGLERYLCWSFVSCDTGVRKPDARAFTGALETLGAEPGQCLFIDDREANCAAARSVKIDAILFTGAHELGRELARRGLLGSER
jgi:HAD superfamily hydrolase (TIGR01509 family)